MTYAVLTRKDAHAMGKVRYFTGRPCEKGHLAERYVTTGSCLECNKQRQKQFAKDSMRQQTARANKMFVYKLHPDDHAAAEAYCMSLQMSRGELPTGRVQYDMPAHVTPPTPGELAEQMRQRFPNVYRTEPEPYIPKL